MIVARQYPLTESQTLSITASVLKRVKPTGQRFTLRDTTVEGLILRVGASGTTSWYIDYRNRDGKRCLFRFGNTKNYNPEEAKAEALRLNGLLASGEDLASDRREAKQEVKRAASRRVPDTLDDYVDGDHPVRVIDAFVDTLDIKALGFSKAETQVTGRKPYHPGDLLKLYIYGYLNQTRSSRRLEKECHRNLGTAVATEASGTGFQDYRRFSQG
jgi:transposase